MIELQKEKEITKIMSWERYQLTIKKDSSLVSKKEWTKKEEPGAEKIDLDSHLIEHSKLTMKKEANPLKNSNILRMMPLFLEVSKILMSIISLLEILISNETETSKYYIIPRDSIIFKFNINNNFTNKN